jgi:hypothetical protein
VDKIARQHWLSQTSCRSDYAINDCAGYKPPKTPTAPSAPTPAPTPTTTTGTTTK